MSNTFVIFNASLLNRILNKGYYSKLTVSESVLVKSMFDEVSYLKWREKTVNTGKIKGSKKVLHFFKSPTLFPQFDVKLINLPLY